MLKYSTSILGIKSLPLMGGALTKLGGAFKWVIGGLRALSLALVSTPIGWVILGITALVAAGYLLVTHWDTVKAWMVGFWQTITSLVDSGIIAVTNLFNGLPEPIKAVLSGIWETMKTVFSWSPLGLIVNNFSEVITFFTGLPAKFSSLGEMTMDGLVKGITGKLTEVKETITNAASNAIGWFKDVLGIASPSKVFAVMGDQTMQGLTVGISRTQQKPLAEVNKLSKQMAGTAFVLGISALPAAAMPNLQAIPDQTRTIRDEYQGADYSVPDAIRLVKEGELPARKTKSDDLTHNGSDLAHNSNGLTHNAAPDRLSAGSAFAQRQAPQSQTVHIDAGIHAPITIHATANMDAQDVARLVAIELEKRDRAQQARLRSSLKDLN
ncbi:hypothetical protein [Shewanella morhuae]|nr:hypothetical protein [Shewanella morhuae]SUJ13474.1 Phage-related protein [Shewanella morhuae]